MKSITKYAVIHSLLTAAYIVIVAFFFFYAPALFGNMPDSVLAPILMLLLFVFSAGLTGALVLGRPILWYLDGKKKEALTLFAYTLACMFAYAVIAFVVLLLIR